MYNNILLAIGITLLFLGVAVQPSIATIQPEEEKLELTESVKIINPQILKVMIKIISNSPYIQEISERMADSECDCEDDYLFYWEFPVICSFLFILLSFLIIILFLYLFIPIYYDFPLVNAIVDVLFPLGFVLNCSWYIHPPPSLKRFIN